MIGLGLGVMLGPHVASSAAAPNPNLLLWSEEFQRAQWGASNATVTPDAAVDPDGGMTADQIAHDSIAAQVSQMSATAAASGATAFEDVEAPAVWTRQMVAGTFDASAFTFSVYLKGDGSTVRIGIDRVGGVLRCFLRDVGDETTYFAWGAKLEQASAATGYIKREGT